MKSFVRQVAGGGKGQTFDKALCSVCSCAAVCCKAYDNIWQRCAEDAAESRV